MVTGDLIDLWLYEGSKGLNYVQASQAYQYTDQYVHYADTYDTVKTQGKSLAGRVQEKVIFFYDEASNFVGILIKVLSNRQDELVKYVTATYSNVNVFVHENWLRLDFNKDGSVSSEDLRANLKEFYEFLKNYHYLEETMRISSSLYDEAKKLIRSEN